MIGPSERRQAAQAAQAHELPVAAQLMTLIVGKMTTQLIYVAAVLGIADLLAEGPQQVESLAAATETSPKALYRVLRALTAMDIFVETGPGRFALTPLAEPLLTDASDSVRQFAIFNGRDWHNQAWFNLLHSVKTGEPAFQHVFGTDLFGYLRQHPVEAQVFNEAMTAMGRQEVPALIHSYDWGSFHTVADIGGGHGKFLSELLKTHVSMHGILFDLPSVTEGARTPFEEAGVAERCEIVGGDFFQSVPRGADAYVLKLILHDWDDEHALRILQNCRESMQPGNKILVLDAVLPPPNQGFVPKVTDVEMLVLTPGGHERTPEEFRQLFSEAGFSLTNVLPTPSRFSIVEGHPR